MFKAIIDWFMVNYEWYLLVGVVFALGSLYGTLRELHLRNKYSMYNYSLNAWGFISILLNIPFYPLFIVVWLLNKLAQWE